ncbi:MAG: capsular polysaccharide export protein, LipB/KpsS family [Erythrobacter sp.]
MQSLVISTLAEYQTAFWLPVGKELVAMGHAVTFVSCDTRSSAMLRSAGLDVIDMTLSARVAALGGADPAAVCAAHGIDNPGPLLTHEKFAFAARDTDHLLVKLAGGLIVAGEALAHAQEKAGAGGEVLVVQELGGFLSVLAVHHAALHAGIESVFIEPSFFKGRMLFVGNSLAAHRLEADARAPVSREIASYFDEAVSSGTVVIPQKDRHHYASAVTKLLNTGNIRRLIEKSRDKYLLGAEQEFGAIGHHVATHLRMLVASRRLRGSFTPLERLGRFLYYPLHVPGDVALTLRSPEYLDQLALLDYLCRTAPADMVIATKEHPAMIGAVGSGGLLALKKRYDRFKILPPTTNNYAVLREAEAIVTVNSKSGVEAGLLGKRVIVLGDAFYREAPFALAVDRLGKLGPAIARADVSRPSPNATRAYFAALWQRTYPGELYVASESNVAQFTHSLMQAVGDRAWQPRAEGAQRLSA